jgi:hypothetical protein
MEKAMDLVNRRFLLSKTTTIFCVESAILQLYTTNGSIESFSCNGREFASTGFSLRKVIE